MGTLFYNWARKIVDKQKAKEEKARISSEEAHKKRMEAWEKHRNLIRDFAKDLTENLEKDYESKNSPKFKVGQSVLLNPYSDGDGWEGSVRQMLHHTEFEGPTEVIIRSVGLDSARLYELIDQWRDRGYFDGINNKSQYSRFLEIVDSRMKAFAGDRSNPYQWVMHYYTFHRPDDPERKKYWRYPMREDKFVSPSSKEGRAALKLWKLECQVKEKQEAAKKAKEEYESLQRHFHEKIGIRYINV